MWGLHILNECWMGPGRARPRRESTLPPCSDARPYLNVKERECVQSKPGSSTPPPANPRQGQMGGERERTVRGVHDPRNTSRPNPVKEKKDREEKTGDRETKEERENQARGNVLAGLPHQHSSVDLSGGVAGGSSEEGEEV